MPRLNTWQNTWPTSSFTFLITYPCSTVASKIHYFLKPKHTTHMCGSKNMLQHKGVKVTLRLTTAVKISHTRIGAAREPWTPKFVAYLVIFCFVRRYPKRNYIARLNSNGLAQNKSCADFATAHTRKTCRVKCTQMVASARFTIRVFVTFWECQESNAAKPLSERMRGLNFLYAVVIKIHINNQVRLNIAL